MVVGVDSHGQTAVFGQGGATGLARRDRARGLQADPCGRRGWGQWGQGGRNKCNDSGPV